MTVPESCDSLMNGSVYVRLKSLMYWPNCQFSEPRLHRPNRFGWSKPMKPPTPAPCPTDAPKFTLPVRFSFTWKMTSRSPCSFGFVSGGGMGVSKKPRLPML